MGDPTKLVQLEAVVNTIKKDNLLQGMKVAGDYLYQNILKMEEKYPQLMKNTRGAGTLIAFDIKVRY